jgi:hypothetical protein
MKTARKGLKRGSEDWDPVADPGGLAGTPIYVQSKQNHRNGQGSVDSKSKRKVAGENIPGNKVKG